MVCCLECCYNVNDENTGGNGHSLECNAAEANRQHRRSSGGGSNSSSGSGPQLPPAPAPAPASAPASSFSVASDGGGASSATHGLRDLACGHGGSVGAPLASFGDGGNQPRLLGATRAGSLDVHSPSNVLTPHRGGVPGAAVSVAIDGGGASGAIRGLRDDECCHDGSVGTPFAPRSDGECQPLSLDATCASSLHVHSPSNVFTSHLCGAHSSVVSVAIDGGGASGATRGLRDDVCGHGGSTSASLATRGVGDCQPLSLGATRASSLGVPRRATSSQRPTAARLSRQFR